MIAHTNAVVASFESYDQARDALREFQTSDFDMEKLSSVGKEYETEGNVVGYYSWVPGIGQLLVAGPLALWIIGALEEAGMVRGLTSLGAGLYSIGIPKKSVLQYETEVKNGKLLLIAHGTSDDVAWAMDILQQTQAETTTIHTKQAAVSRAS